jgi:hypothetical protein
MKFAQKSARGRNEYQQPMTIVPAYHTYSPWVSVWEIRRLTGTRRAHGNGRRRNVSGRIRDADRGLRDAGQAAAALRNFVNPGSFAARQSCFLFCVSRGCEKIRTRANCHLAFRYDAINCLLSRGFSRTEQEGPPQTESLPNNGWVGKARP